MVIIIPLDGTIVSIQWIFPAAAAAGARFSNWVMGTPGLQGSKSQFDKDIPGFHRAIPRFDENTSGIAPELIF